MRIFFLLHFFLLSYVFSIEKINNNISSDPLTTSANSLGRIGDHPYPDNPSLDRAKGYLLKGKIKNAVSNFGNFITWDYHPAGLWQSAGGSFAYLPHVGFVAGVPGHVYSSKWSTNTYQSWELETEVIGNNEINLWKSSDAYNDWMEDIDIELWNKEGVFKTVVYNTVDDRGDIGVNRSSISDFDINGEVQWMIDHVDEKIILYLNNESLDPNYPESNIGLAYPWGIRPVLENRTEEFDKYDYGEDLEEWTEDDNYVYYGATFSESWFTRDNGAKYTDWQATTGSRFNTHTLDVTAGDEFGMTDYTDSADPEPILAHSALSSTWPERYNADNAVYERFWPGWWADQYYGENEDQWPELNITDCQKNRLDDDCWKSVKNRFISDMDVFMEFDDRWAHLGNQVENNKYEQTGYPMGLKVQSMAHSYGISYAEDVMFVTVKVRNESGDFCAYEVDKYGNNIPVKDSDGNVICESGMIMPDGTKLGENGQGFNYKDLYLGFYMDADVLSTDATGNFNVHSNDDDFMMYIDCLHEDSKHLYPDGCPEAQGNTLRISMAVIGDYDGQSQGPTGYSMRDDVSYGTDFGVVAVQLLDSPYASDPVDLDQDGEIDIAPGEKLKMTDWHWFDWYNRPGVVSAESDNNCCAGEPNRPQARNKEEIQYKVIAGDNTNLSEGENKRYFHTPDPSSDLDIELNPHFDSLEGLKETTFFTTSPDGLDCVLEMSTGPFDLNVGQTVSFSFGIIYGQDINDLLLNAKFAQIMYNSHYQGYTAPDTPDLFAQSQHEQVELFWDDVAELSKDVITGYTDFEGYKIYKSIDGGTTWGAPEDEIILNNSSQGWHPYKQFDLSYSADSAFNVTDEFIRGTGVSGPDSLAPWFSLGDNSGLEQLLLDPDCHNDLNNPSCNPDSIYACDSYGNCCGMPSRLYIEDSNSDGVSDSLNAAFLDYYPDCEGLNIWKSSVGEKYILSRDISSYKYKFVDNHIVDGMEYTYSVVAYDMGVTPTVTNYDVPVTTLTNDTIGYSTSVSSIPDPDGWGKENPFKMLESGKGTTLQDKNFVTIVPGYLPASDLNNIKVVPNPYIVHSKFNETEYKKKMRFTRLPIECTITIYTITGEKVQELHHDNPYDGNEWWDLRTYNNQEVAPGLYIYVVEAPGGGKIIDKFAVVR